MIESNHAELGDVRLHWLAVGFGSPIVFVHGFPEFSDAWAPQLREFGRDHRALAPSNC